MTPQEATWQSRVNLCIAYTALDHAMSHMVDDSDTYDILYPAQKAVGRELWDSVSTVGQFEGILDRALRSSTPGLLRLEREISLKLD